MFALQTSAFEGKADMAIALWNKSSAYSVPPLTIVPGLIGVDQRCPAQPDDIKSTQLPLKK
ncbi:MAG: hypothetical protein WCD54_16750 [Pseudolabrys sp.]